MYKYQLKEEILTYSKHIVNLTGELTSWWYEARRKFLLKHSPTIKNLESKARLESFKMYQYKAIISSKDIYYLRKDQLNTLHQEIINNYKMASQVYKNDMQQLLAFVLEDKLPLNLIFDIDSKSIYSKKNI